MPIVSHSSMIANLMTIFLMTLTCAPLVFFSFTAPFIGLLIGVGLLAESVILGLCKYKWRTVLASSIASLMLIAMTSASLYWVESGWFACDGPYYPTEYRASIDTLPLVDTYPYRDGVLGISEESNGTYGLVLWYRDSGHTVVWAAKLEERQARLFADNALVGSKIGDCRRGVIRDRLTLWLEDGGAYVYIWRHDGVHRFYLGS